MEDLAELLQDMNQKVDVKPWTIEPEIDPSKLGRMWLFCKSLRQSCKYMVSSY